MKYTKTVRININDSEVKAELSFYYTQEIPGVYTALPENCYPTEPEEFDLVKLETEDGVNYDWLIEHIADDLIGQIQ